VLVFPQVKLYFTENALHLIAKKAAAKEMGARGLRSIMEDILTEAMFEVEYYLNIAMQVNNQISACLTAISVLAFTDS